MHPRGRLVVLIAVSATISVLAGGAFVQLRANASWAAMEQRITELSASWDARSFERRPAWGEATAGSAWAAYGSALARAQELIRDGNYDDLVGTMPHRDDTRVAGSETLRERWRPALEQLRAGAHRVDAKPPASAWSEPPLNLMSARWLVNMAVLEARAARLANDGMTAVRWTLDAATFATDAARNGSLINQLVGTAVLHIATREAWPDAALRQLPAEALDLLATGLEHIDALLPSFVDYDAELLAIGAFAQTPEGPQLFDAPGWRHGFSTRWLLADGFLRACAKARTVHAPGTQVQGDPRTDALWTSATREMDLLCAVANVRLLRLAVAEHQGKRLELPDPFGGTLRAERDERGVTFRSSYSGRPIEMRVER
jgi:hypothetical protein